MKEINESIGQKILRYWHRVNRLPAGQWIFAKIVARTVPYSGSIRSKILELKPGYTKILLKDRRPVRNHVNSIHAIALANLGELSSGMALLTGLPANVRGIVININIEYLKKARGNLIAEGWAQVPVVKEDIVVQVHSEIRDQQGDMVSRVVVDWKLGVIKN
ncbi:MAG: DUF4442 domain-containing protein [Gammaproteobacteria bacterium]|nr:DUF4442 domain-containing protein [Gammaproteobacteria bacterium]MDH5692637.1 DUF4442 domain-containing protein [Gammaproteobacteria bacterium]